MEAEIGVICLQVKKYQVLPAAARSEERGMEWILAQSLLKEPVLPIP